MKNILLLLSVAVLFGCTPSETNQQKAEKMVKVYLDSTLKDPQSYQPELFGKLDTLERTLRIRHKYRSKNSFGGFVVEDNYYFIDSAMTTVTCCQTLK